jgi:hypothetical protein
MSAEERSPSSFWTRMFVTSVTLITVSTRLGPFQCLQSRRNRLTVGEMVAAITGKGFIDRRFGVETVRTSDVAMNAR